MAGAEQHKLREYLLSQLTEAEAEQVELRLLTDSGFGEEYDLVVNEITDDYVAGKFAGKELEQVYPATRQVEIRAGIEKTKI